MMGEGARGCTPWTVVRKALLIVLRVLPGLLLGTIPSLLSTTPEAMAENAPRWVAWVSLLVRAMIPATIADFIMSFWGWLTFMSIGVLLAVGLNIPPRWYPWRHGRAAATAPGSSGAARPVPEAESAPLQEERIEERIVVNVAPEYLWGAFKERTSIQARGMLAGYVGKWMEVSGLVRDVGEGIVTFNPGLTTTRRIHARFHDDRWMDRLSLLRPGDQITVLGQIGTITAV